MEMSGREIGAAAIDLILYGILFTGLIMVMLKELAILSSRFRSYRRLRARKKGCLPETMLDLHIRQLLLSTLGSKISPGSFRTLTSGVFLLVLLTGARSIPIFQAIPAALILSILPYMMLRIRLESIRRKSSFEGEILISSFLSQYRIRHFNIYETIEGILAEDNELKSTRKLLFRLLIDIRNTGNDQLIADAAKSFSFAINTNWSRMLSNSIKTAATKGINISLALEDILIQLREARTLAEERKRLNSEAVRMTIFMVPIMYAATVIMSVHYLSMPLAKFIGNQFYTTEGFTLFLGTLFLFMINLMLIESVQNQRFDY